MADIKVLLQALNRPWFIDYSQALYWEKVVSDMLLNRTMNAIPSSDNRGFLTRLGVFERVDANNNLTENGPVQLMYLEGPLMKYDYCGTPGMETLQRGIRAFNADDSIEAGVLVVDSPGGTVDGTDNLAREVKNSGKPIVTLVNGMMGSAAYWIGSGASEIIVDNANGGYNATIGSIGCMATWEDRTSADEASGVKRHVVRATKSTRKNVMMQEANQGNYDRITKDLDNLLEGFLSAVQENRGDKLRLDLENVLEGDVYDGKQAVKFGLADKIADLPYAIKRSLQLAKTIKIDEQRKSNF